MTQSYRKIVIALICIALLFGMCTIVSAHSGRTDGNGGHKDNQNKSGLGNYHYHCGGYPAHLHTAGYCPYKDIFPSSVQVNAEKTTLRLGESIAISASIKPSNSCNTDISWTSSNTDVVNVENGKIVSVGYGTATIRASSFNGKVGKLQIIVKEVTAEKLDIEHKVDELFIGEEYQLSCTIIPNDVDNSQINWSSNDPTVATVSPTGTIIAIGAGRVTITATASNGVSSSVNLLVKAKDVEAIDILEENMRLYLRDSISLTATVTPTDATYPEISWKSSNSDIVSISEDGIITAKSCGIAEITATSSNGLSDTLEIIVDEIIAQSIKITGSNSLQNSSSMQMGVSFFPTDTTVQDIQWISSNENILTIDSNGIISAHNLGIATITAIQKDTQASLQIEVLPIPVTSVKIQASIPEKIYVGDSISFNATVLPTNASYPEVNWSTDSWIARIDNTGTLSTYFCGKVIVTASTADNKYDMYEIFVCPPKSIVCVLTLLCLGGCYFLLLRKASYKKRNV